jgi:hypothetical protein
VQLHDVQGHRSPARHRLRDAVHLDEDSVQQRMDAGRALHGSAQAPHIHLTLAFEQTGDRVRTDDRAFTLALKPQPAHRGWQRRARPRLDVGWLLHGGGFRRPTRTAGSGEVFSEQFGGGMFEDVARANANAECSFHRHGQRQGGQAVSTRREEVGVASDVLDLEGRGKQPAEFGDVIGHERSHPCELARATHGRQRVCSAAGSA